MAANFKPGDKVWIENHGGRVAPGTYAGVTIAVAEAFPEGWWVVYVEGIQLPDGTSYLYAHEKILRPRDDPPRQQEPKREATGSWDDCKWRPARDWRPDPPNIVRITVTVPARKVDA